MSSTTEILYFVSSVVLQARHASKMPIFFNTPGEEKNSLKKVY